MTKPTYVIINTAGKFYRGSGFPGFQWMSEYPDASIWTGISPARAALHSLAEWGHAAVCSLIRDYGLDSQETIEI